jgi:uncharacterized protein (DUF488 family)
MTLFTIGHSTRSLDAFRGLLTAAGVTTVADIRHFPYSRRHPQFNAADVAPGLAAVGIGYRHIVALGGRRGPRRDGKASPHTLWREPGFRNYADYAETEAFRAGLAELMALARDGRVAIMCAEAAWWRCHRRIVTDYLLHNGLPVRHILDPGRVEPASLTPGAAPRPDGTILYATSELLL